MNIKHENVPGLVQDLVIEIQKDDYAANLEAALKKQRRNTVLPGFRPGNAPMGLVKKQYGQMLLLQEVDKIVNEQLDNYFKEGKINFLFQPLPIPEKSKVDFENESDFVFAYQYVLAPEFEIDYSAMPVFKEFKMIPTEEQITAAMEPMRRNFGNYTSPDTVAEDDALTISYGDNKSGFVFMKDMKPEVKKEFIGKKLNESVNVALRDAFLEDETLQRVLGMKKEDMEEGNEYRYDITITHIGRMELAELNEDFFKKAFADGSVKNEEEYRQWAINKILSEVERDINQCLLMDVSDTFVDKIDMEIPKDFIKRYMLATNEKLTEEDFDKDAEMYFKSFKWQMIENRIANEGKVEVETQELRDYFHDYFMAAYFSQFGGDIDHDRMEKLIDQAMDSRENVKAVYDLLFDKKMLNYLRTKLNLEYVEGDSKALMDFILHRNDKPEDKKAEKVAKAENADKTEKTEEPEKEAKPVKKTTTKKTTTAKKAAPKKPEEPAK